MVENLPANAGDTGSSPGRSEEHTSELQSHSDLVCRLLLEKKKKHKIVYEGDFPGGAVVKNPSANAGDTGSSPGPGRSHMLRSN